MKNIDMIKSAFEAHKKGDLEQAEKLAKRITNNFNLQNDDFFFAINAVLYQPYADVSRQLVKDSRSSLIGDLSLPKRVDLKIVINVNVVTGNGSLRVIFDDEGIKSITQQRAGQHTSNVNTIVESWLESEFGKVN